MPEIVSKAMDEVHAHLDIDFKSLDFVVAQINLEKNRGVISFKHWQQAQCRLLLLLSDIKEILVCPDRAFLEEIRIVAPREIIRNGILNNVLRESNLKLKDYGLQLTPDILQDALQFSLIARLSPNWKAVVKSEANSGDILVNGSHFLTNSSNSPVDAVKLRVFAKGCEMWIGVCAYRLRLPVVRPEYLDISFNYIERVLACSGRGIGESKIGDPSVYVLPSLKKGKVTLLTNGIPNESEFQNYLHVQRHWKDTFGLLLPKAETGKPLLFADVKLEESNRSFVYPLQCLLRTQPVILKHDDPWSLVKSVLKMIKTLVPILLLEINENHFLTASPELKNKPDIVEEDFQERTKSETSWNNSTHTEFSNSTSQNRRKNTIPLRNNPEFSEKDFQERTNSNTSSDNSTHAELSNSTPQNRRKNTIPNGSCRYRLSLKKYLNETPTSTGNRTNNLKLPTQHSKSSVAARLSLSVGAPKKRKLVPDTTENSSNVASKPSPPNQPKKKAIYGRPLKPQETIESLFQDGALERAQRKDLIEWLRNKKISRGVNKSKAMLICKIRAALMNTTTSTSV